MIHYRVTCVNRETVSGASTLVEYVIFDNIDEQPVSTCDIDRQVKGNVEYKVVKFTVFPTHPYVDKINQLMSTIYAYDDGAEVFRGRVTNIDTDKYGRKKITCESDIKFLVDVPDVFSMRTDGEPKYYIGYKGNEDDAFQPLHFKERGTWTDANEQEHALYEFREINPLISQPEVWSDYHFRPEDVGRKFTVAVRNAATDHEAVAVFAGYLAELESLVGEGGTVTAENEERVNELLLLLEMYIGAGVQVVDGVIPDYDVRIGAAENYIENDIVFAPQNYEIPLVKETIRRPNKPEMPITLLYFGNINLAYDNSGIPDNQNQPGGTEKRLSGGDIKERLEVERQRTTAKGSEYDFTIPGSITIPPASETGGIDFSALDFCIVHRHDPAEPDEVTAGLIAFRGSDVTWAWTLEKPPIDGNISFLVKRDTRTTALNMFNSIFTEPPGEGETPDNSTGYNKYCGADRHIYRGTLPELAADLGIDNADVSTVYQNVEKIAKTTNTYATIRKNNDGYYLLDFISRDGTESNDFRVVFGDNVMDYSKSANVNNLATAILPKGVYKTKDGDAATQVIDTLTGITPVSGYTVNTDLNIVIHTASSAIFGVVILYKEYDISGLNVGEVRSAWREYLYSRAVADLSRLQEETVSFDISAVDPRLIHGTGAAPQLGAKYPVDIPLFGAARYIRLVRVYTDMIQPSRSKLAFGENRTLLSDITVRRA